MIENVNHPSDSGFFQIAYVSSAVRPFSDFELQELLEKSRRNNEASSLTGMLLYKNGNFMQVLEGSKATVVASMAKIKEDPRHRGVIILVQEPKGHRDFAEWSMGFKKLAPYDDKNPGSSDFLDGPLGGDEYTSNPAKSLKLLRSFRKNMR